MREEFEWVHEPGLDRDLGSASSQDLASIIKTCTGLPPEVLSAKFSYVAERKLNRETFSLLTELPSEASSELMARCRRRRLALANYVNQRLVCVCIQLPGVLYTIEIDPLSEEVIHWEWQQV